MSRPFTTNEFTVKDSFHFVKEIVDQQTDFFMGSLYVDSLFTIIPLKETIKNYTNLFKKYWDTGIFRKWRGGVGS